MLNLTTPAVARPSDDTDLTDMDSLEDVEGNVERGDTASIFKELGDTIHADTHAALVELKNSPEMEIWPTMYQNSLSLYKALNILHEQEPRHSGIKSSCRHAFLEVRAFGLLMCEQALVEDFESTKDQSILSNLICTNKELRQIYALWRWCQDIETQDTGGFCDLAEEYNALSKVQNARSGSLRALASGQKKYGIDVDAPGTEEDQEILDRHVRTLFSCIRNYKVDEAIQLAHDNGLAALAAPLKLYKLLVDPSLSPSDPLDENSQITTRWLGSAKLLHKMVDSPKPSSYTRMLWAAVSGRLQPLLSMATRTTDRLWCFANAAVINIFLEACTGEKLEEVPRSIETIFAEITIEEKSPYYSIYSYLLSEDWDGLINWMVEYRESRIASDSKIDDQLVRFMASLAAIARITQQQHDEVAAASLFSLLIDRLVERSLYSIIPFYAAFLPRQTADDRLLDIMENIRGDTNRREYLFALEESDFDRDHMAITVASDTGDLTAANRIDNLRWLLLNGERTLDSALAQINCLVRYFTVNDDHQTALDVLNLSAKFDIPEKLNAMLETVDKKSLPAIYLSNISEYECHRLYFFETFPSCEKFTEQAISIKTLLSDTKKLPVTAQLNWREMRLQQATVQAVRDMSRESEISRRRSTAHILKQKTADLIQKLLQHKGWYPSVSDDRQRCNELERVRHMCCSSVIELYLASCNALNDQQAIEEASVMICNTKFHIEKAVGKEDLQRILKKIAEYTKTTIE